ncbi:MAG: PA14 domain-containing protein [Phycisphaerales bacterium]
MCRKLIHLVTLVCLLGLASLASAEIPRDPNLVIFYSYDSVGAIVPDESGKGHNGTVCGDVSLAPSGIKWYGAARFQGELGPTGYSYLDLDSPHYATEDIPKSAITLAAWVQCTKTGKDHAILSCRGSDNTWVVHPQINDNGSFRWLLRGPGSVTIFNLNGVGTHGWDEWLHYAGTYDSVTGKGILYINGVVCAQIDVPVGQVIADWGTGARVGYNIDNARPFTGIMDEFYLFTRAMSLDEVNVLLAAEGLLSEKATHPNPADGAELDTTSTILQWLPGAYAASNDVYFGVDFADVNNGANGTFKGNQAEAEFAVSDLQWGTTYYWRIDGVNTVEPNSPWKGDVWSFLLRPSTAWDPTPADGARWIDPNADLTWSTGRNAGMHYVYFGDNFDDVNNATGASPQGEATYDPGTLAFEKVYYWRVDELDDSGTTHKGSVWSFTTMRADSGVRAEYYKGTNLETLVMTRVDPGINMNWGAAAPDPLVPADNFSVRWTGELEVPFTSAWTFTANCDDCVRLWVNEQLLFDKWGQQGGVEWTGTIDLAAGQKYGIVMEYYENSGDARAKLYWNSPYWLSPYQPKQIIPQGAYSLPVKARSPNPANSAVGVPQVTVLTWSAGEHAVSHDVYFGADPNAVRDANTSSPEYKGSVDLGSESYDPGELEWNTTYYWRVDEVNDADPNSPWKGSVWSFTTADFLVVEDFEAYNDDEAGGTAIFQTWIDGVANGTTSYVGYSGSNNGTFGETTIVHGGLQSMPLSYNNSVSPYYAQTDRTWDTAQDWTIYGVNTLVLYIQGGSSNASEPLYVAVEDRNGKIVTIVHSDARIVTATTWTEWRIPLSQFAGVDMTRVKAMHIGLGSKTSPALGGAGVIYVDDIRVATGE